MRLPPRRTAQFVALLAVVAATLATPLAWRAVNAAWAPALEDLPASYLPALEARRARRPFDEGHIDGLERMQPGYVIIGDSMGGRIDPRRLDQLSGRPVAPLLRNATGSAAWYLMFKNYVVASDIDPALVIVFFRDTNLTDPLWRATDFYRETLDRMARDQEPALNDVMAARTTGAWHRAHAALDEAYQVERTRAWVEPALLSWLSRVVVGNVRRAEFPDDVNAMFALDRLRPMGQADMAAAEALDTDFDANVETSVLPLMLDLAREHDLRLCFVRVLRRTEDGQVREQSEALSGYVADLRAYVEARGALFFDDRDDPAMATIAYGDGDHIARGEDERYTELFWQRLSRN